MTKEEKSKIRHEFYLKNKERLLLERVEYSRSIKGLITEFYSRQKQRSKVRGHPLPEYTKQMLSDWVLSNIKFYKLYKDWIDSGYDTLKKPSIDRIDSSIHYRIDNIQLVTRSQNAINANVEFKSKTIIQYNSDGSFVKEWVSAREAGRNGYCQSSVSRCCNGEYKQHKGFIWKYKTEDD